jgi:hypothetical protein
MAVFYLAQAHGLLGDRAASAAFCGATLNRQAAEPGALPRVLDCRYLRRTAPRHQPLPALSFQ